MQKNTGKSRIAKKRPLKTDARVEKNAHAPLEATRSQGTPGGSFDTLKENMKKIDKGSLFDALKRVKDMKPEAWRDPSSVRDLTQNIAQDIGIKVDPRRMNAFLNAFTDATKNADDKGPKVSVEEIAKKYGGDAVDEKTIKEIKKFVK
ncbi:hypothetical protein [Ferroacidibacillus organovorans]|uniref:Uncharacterized protein n=1 Tax=Ferroacidibacillus organovorans TaxID=1765683 RepID=A0A101XSA1_9BACL|nr:hypothetical protein [Ferroacidibacillus organovorans]KUO96610.1 hypothetical protein ATW55_00585 [Ferroacidibacillus organovorans]